MKFELLHADQRLQVVVLSITFAACELLCSTPHDLKATNEVRLGFESGFPQGRPWTTRAAIQEVRSVGDDKIVLLRFLIPLNRNISVPSSVLQLVNRRGAIRVRPRDEAPVSIELSGLHDDDVRFRGNVSDLSITGAKVSLIRSRFLAPLSGDLLFSQLTFPHGYGHSTLHCRVLHVRQARSDTLIVQLKFLDSDLFGASTFDPVVAYIMHRQREVARDRSADKEPEFIPFHRNGSTSDT